jgi:integrase/recombinase XerD
MHSSSRGRVVGPLGPYVAGFDGELARLGFTPLSACGQLELVAHLSRWLAAQGLDETALTVAVVEEFLAARRAAGCTRRFTGRALRPLLTYLRGRGVVPAPTVAVPGTPVEVLLERYRRYLRVERGLTEGTVGSYVGLVRPFLAGRIRAGGLDLEGVRAGDVTAFVLEVCSHRSPKTAQRTASALRSLLGFLHLNGLVATSLSAAVPAVANRRPAGLPRALEPGQVRALLASCDRATTSGLRDCAILTLLVRLGLRAGEVAGLGLDDLDWRHAEIIVRGKGNRRDRLPLPADAGEAVAGYLQRGRPATAQDRRVFIRLKAPHHGLSSCAVTMAVFTAAQRAGLGAVYAHRLRHSAATGMLRVGASLAEIGQLLRHRRPSTTAVYARVDVGALRALARPWSAAWPGGAA